MDAVEGDAGRTAALRAALGERVVIADGAMGSMLQGSAATLDDFAGHEGCNEILNVTRPDIVLDIHHGYLAAGVDCVTTNTFGANLGNLGEYGIEDRIEELAEAGARLARQAAGQVASAGRPRWVLGSIGPGTKLPTLGHVAFARLRDTRRLAARWPVLLGGAALTRAYVEQDLAGLFDGEVRYARDAFEGQRLMDAFMAVRRGSAGAQLPALRRRRVRPAGPPGPGSADAGDQAAATRSAVSVTVPVPEPPFWGSRVVKGIPLAEYAAFLDERALFLGQWGLKPARGRAGPSHQELAETGGRPRLRMWLERAQTEGLLQAAVVAGYFRCVSAGNDLIVLDQGGAERERFRFPRQRRDRRLCLADFFRPGESGETDVVAFQLVTVGPKISEATADLFAKNAYRDYLELHGLSVQLAEALAEYWHARVRGELGIGGADPADLDGILKVGYHGCRYSFGYPACPDLEDRAKVMRLLEPDRIGVTLSEEFQLAPEQSTDAVITHHPEARYFST